MAFPFVTAAAKRLLRAVLSSAAPADLTAPAQLALIQSYRSAFSSSHPPIKFNDAGFCLYSQHEEDGLLLYIFALLGTTNKICVEICAGDGQECNTANLLLNHRWCGVLFDGNPENVSRGMAFFARHPATRHWPPRFQCRWITRTNINELIAGEDLTGEVDLLSIDMDGVDYWIWEELTIIRPRVVVLEFNHLWGPVESVTVPYAEDFKAGFSVHGSDYGGASLAAFVKLARRKGYRLVGTNAFATNAFFVRADLPHPWLPEISALKCFDHPRARFGSSKRLPRVKDRPWAQV